MSSELEDLYRNRFDEQALARKSAIWRVLCRDYFQQYVRDSDTVLDIACGTGEFINHIVAAKRIGVDLREESRASLDPAVTFLQTPATDLDGIGAGNVDVAFTSNFLEHLRSKDEMLALFRAVHHALRPGGRFLIMGPNIRYAPGAYWDFLDHHLPLSERTVAEGLELCGFDVTASVARFLPYSTKSRLPQAPWLVALYLKVPLAWRILGRQFFIVAVRPVDIG
jgi:SAM-dependent methyltransferase